MADPAPPLLVYFVIGEQSGDTLGADLMAALREQAPGVAFAGLAGPRMQAQGMASLYDIADTAVMGLSGVVARLPTLIARIRQVTDDIVARRPAIVVAIDSPDFTHRVARRVRRALPDLPIVKYVCPSVWAWRPGRARAMARVFDHVLALLPFEPRVLAELGGPPATHVGHPLALRYAAMTVPDREHVSQERVLLVLPGSRRSEARLLLPDIDATLRILAERGNSFRAVLPVVPHLEGEVRRAVERWAVKPEIVTGEEAKLAAFARADAALAASGTVLLELALWRIPAISIYRLDWLMHTVRHLITGWSAALPNLITDEALVPERVGDMIRPGWLARALEELLTDGLERRRQLEGYGRMAQAMATDEPPGTIAARKVLEFAVRR